MTKRQRKKQFKKLNSINLTQITTDISCVQDAVKLIVDGFGNMFKVIVKFMQELPQKVRDMPEEEFQKILNSRDLNEDNKQLLIKLRGKG